MNKILILFKREYRAAVRTKSFIISLVLVPILMGGGLLAMIIMENNEDTDDKNFVVIDHSGLMEESIQNAADLRNRQEILDPESGEKVMSAYRIEFLEPDTDNRMTQQSELSERVKKGELRAFIR